MKLLSRNSEIELLRRQRWLSEEQFSRMTLITGRRLSGKTALIAEAYSDKPFLYFRLSGKTDSLLLEEFSVQVGERLGLHVPESVRTFRQLMEYLFRTSEENPMTVVLEDFDELIRRSPDYYTVLRNFWKSHRRSTNVNLVLTVSNPAHAAAIFDDPKAPLLNTLDMKILLGFLTVAEIKAQMSSAGREWSPEDLLTMFMVTGGCPKYVSLACSRGAVTRDEMLDLFLGQDSIYMADMRAILSEALGHNSEVYMSLLQLIASGVRTLGDLEARLGGIIVGGHLAKLENDYGLIVKTRPVLASEKSRNVVRYEITDQMMCFWLRYAEGRRYLAEIGNMAEIRVAMDRDRMYRTEVLMRYFREKFAQENGLPEVGGDWKAGRDSVFEMDVVGLDRVGRQALLADVELDASTFEKDPFLKRANALKDGPLWGYSVDTRLFTLADM